MRRGVGPVNLHRGLLSMLAISVLAGGCVAPTPAADAGTRPRGAPSLSAMEAEVLTETNRARSNPTAYAAVVEATIARYEGLVLRRPGSGPVDTYEGVAAVREAAAVLRRTASLRPLTISRGLSAAARDLVDDQSRTGRTGHPGSDGSSPAERADRHGRWLYVITENIAYGPPTGRDMVMGLLVDDGVPDRGHRLNILDPRVTVVGVACGSHPRFEHMCVILYAGGYAEASRTQAFHSSSLSPTVSR